MENKNPKVDIIIPIYNALDDLKICLESFYKNTNLDENRLILINTIHFSFYLVIYLYLI